ncbi:hypothetical protein HZA42_04355 [Candidatus Peregrinibacteria bacterium]|nr:hypothetical protein [Candidatus Peregrinibacteria bacterium]
MKKIIALAAFALLIPGIVLAAEISKSTFRCYENPETENPTVREKLQKVFITNDKTQRITQVCTKGSIFFILREDDSKKYGHLVRGGAYNFSTAKKYFETNGHQFPTTCEISDTSTTQKIDYLCYNRTVASDHDNGKEFSFKFPSKKTYVRECEVHFPMLPEEICGKWKKLK